VNKLTFEKTEFEDLFIVNFSQFLDDRGILIKPWISHCFKDIFGVNVETYITKSVAKSIRGLHFQTGVRAQKKFIACLDGKIEDIVVDMRKNSKTFGSMYSITLNGMSEKGLLVPEGFAHGVYAYEDSIFVNFSNKYYSPKYESGIFWSSVEGLEHLSVTTISEKDAALPEFNKIFI